MTVKEFCTAHRISKALFYELLRQGRGPAIIKIGKATRISAEAAEKWRRELEQRSRAAPKTKTLKASAPPLPGIAMGRAVAAAIRDAGRQPLAIR